MDRGRGKHEKWNQIAAIFLIGEIEVPVSLHLLGELCTIGEFPPEIFAPVGKGAGMSSDSKKAAQVSEIMSLFDYLIESSKLGIRKPDPRIYALMCEALDVDPNKCVYLDDLGINLKPARAMGMHTIKVLNEAQLSQDLRQATSFEGI